MKDRFASLVKVPQHPAARLLSMANIKLDTPIDAPASASVETVLAELEAKGAVMDMLLLMAVALPSRERVWWACLAARDSLPKGAKPPPPLAASEAWVFKPSEENRVKVKKAIDTAAVRDDTVHAATAALFCDGTLGPGDFKQYDAPPGAAEMSAFAMNVIALCADASLMDEASQVMLDRALDIARGGSGNIPMPVAVPEVTEGKV